jgi:hypothetical protein
MRTPSETRTFLVSQVILPKTGFMPLINKRQTTTPWEDARKDQKIKYTMDRRCWKTFRTQPQ